MAGVPLMVVAKHLGYAVSLRACLAQVGSEQQAGILAGLQGTGRSAHHYHVVLRRVVTIFLTGSVTLLVP
jgi:hypothetical protein